MPLAAVARSERGGLRRRGGWPSQSLSAIAKNSAVRSTLAMDQIATIAFLSGGQERKAMVF